MDQLDLCYKYLICIIVILSILFVEYLQMVEWFVKLLTTQFNL